MPGEGEARSDRGSRGTEAKRSPCRRCQGPLAQSEERRTRLAEVVDSRPIRSAKDWRRAKISRHSAARRIHNKFTALPSCRSEAYPPDSNRRYPCHSELFRYPPQNP